MVYFQVDRIIDQYVMEAQYNNEINNTWGPEADVAVDNRAGSSGIATATKQKAANHYVGYLYFMHLSQIERAKAELDLFNAVFTEFLTTLATTSGTSSAYGSWQSEIIEEEDIDA